MSMSMTLGEVREALIDLSISDADDIEVKFDFGAFPSHIISWLGSYDEPSLDNDSLHSITISNLIKILDEALGGLKTYRGYKGGEYTFTSNQVLWADSYGTCGERSIEYVIMNSDGFVELITSYSYY